MKIMFSPLNLHHEAHRWPSSHKYISPPKIWWKSTSQSREWMIKSVFDNTVAHQILGTDHVIEYAILQSLTFLHFQSGFTAKWPLWQNLLETNGIICLALGIKSKIIFYGRSKNTSTISLSDVKGCNMFMILIELS